MFGRSFVLSQRAVIFTVKLADTLRKGIKKGMSAMSVVTVAVNVPILYAYGVSTFIVVPSKVKIPLSKAVPERT